MFITLSALIEYDAEGIGGSGFVECIKEHIHSVSTIPEAHDVCPYVDLLNQSLFAPHRDGTVN